MEHSEYYEADVLAYFSGKPEELALYEESCKQKSIAEMKKVPQNLHS